ncbi:hypothetical protein FQN57_007372 [Myotisia sp. PD_48]|nr:hypothetical protein FQN57_007372 [Myotisia sp. PD_48]
MQSTPAPKRRSRSGCTECRQRHRKCDELKPACTACQRAGKPCTYTLRLSWGGRPFSKSRFGDCMKKDPGLVQVPVFSSAGNTAFIYGSKSQPVASPVHEEDIQDGFPSVIDLEETPIDSSQTWLTQSSVAPYYPTGTGTYGGGLLAHSVHQQIFQNPFEFHWMPKPQRALLDHFMSCTTSAISCHPVIQNTYCRVLVPMAVQTPHLYHALLSLSATHRLSLGLNQSLSELDYLKFTSLRQLQDALSHPQRHLDEPVIATAITLCTSDLVSDGRSPGSWRSHLQGATAVIAEHLQNARDSETLSEAKSLLWRWYLSIESVALLSGNLVVSTGSRTALQMRRLITSDGIDDLTGFSSSLIPIFKDINLLAIESGLVTDDTPNYNTDNHMESHTRIPNSLIRERCYRLIESVRSMLACHEPKFKPTIDASLSTLHRIDFAAVDETFHHVALLQLYRRILDLPSSDSLVQDSVKRIIQRVSKIHFLDEPCPGVAVLVPLFTAGCEASNDVDREDIKFLLTKFECRYGMGNAKSCRNFLIDLWAMRDVNGDSEGRVRWDKVMVEKGLDILPY